MGAPMTTLRPPVSLPADSDEEDNIMAFVSLAKTQDAKLQQELDQLQHTRGGAPGPSGRR